MEYFEKKSIKNLTSLRIGGKASKFYILENMKELKDLLLSIPKNEKHKIRILGGGTNLLVKDDEVLDLIIFKLEGEFQKVCVDKNKIMAGSGAFLNNLLKETINFGYSGLEILAGIPGTVGGAVLGNAGSKLVDISKFIKKLEVMNYQGKIENLSKKDIIFNYRNPQFPYECIILHVELDKKSFKYSENNKKLLQKFRLILDEKIANQPYNTRNAGCVFKNVSKKSAESEESVGKIIDELGLKGTSIGDVKISEKHANFFIAGENAKYKDYIGLMNFVSEKVKIFKNLDIEPEIKIWR